MHTRMQLFTSAANSWDVKSPTIVGRKIPYNPTQNVIITDIARTAIEDRIVSPSTEHSQMSMKAETKGAEQLPRSHMFDTPPLSLALVKTQYCPE